MSSTFFGLTIASSGLNTSQAQINTTANNISNVNTEGYSRQVVNTVSASALRVYQSYGTTGVGVEAESVTQCRDLYYDEKYWNNESALGHYDKKLYYMKQIQDFYSETGSNTGFSTIYSKMFNSLSTLQGSAGDLTVRKEFISNAKELVEYFNQLSTKLNQLQSSVNDEIKTAVSDINSIAEKITILNKQINVIEQGGGHANELRDQRALLVDELSALVNVETKEVNVSNTNFADMDTGATQFTVRINGQMLVDNYEYKTLAVQARADVKSYNQCDIKGLYDIVWSEEGDKFNSSPISNGGAIKAMFDVRDGNNNENLHGTITSTTTNTVTVTGLSITDVNEFNMPDEGTIWTNNTEYDYTDFSFDTDENGDVVSITFTFDKDMSAGEQTNLMNKSLQVGDDIDYMGIPYYQNQMNMFLRNFCEEFNLVEEGGVDLNGDTMGSFFVALNLMDTNEEYGLTDRTTANTTDTDGNITGTEGVTLTSDSMTYYRLTAGNVAIAKKTDKDAAKFATTSAENYTAGVDNAELVVKLQELQSKVKLFRGGGGDTFLQCIYADVTIDTQECDIFTKNFTNIQTTISQQRQSVAGVDEDDEALDLIKFQNAYNLASKCISVFSEIYDRLILNTGV
ncbi:MAG: flagellar hook-associated protein FlgK [Pseudobutyrivibrio sp.]|nr:flagellar hook-associated protein FlgK [Pseudobutyrivibrio sp.]